MDRSPLLDAEKILAILEKHEVNYVVIGALAATFHGSPLRTDDLDICPERSADNLDRLSAALREMNAREWDPHKGEAVERQFTGEMLAVDKLWILVTRFGDFDLVFEPAGFAGYKELSRNATAFELDDIRVRVAALEDVIRSKEAADREKDHLHLSTLRRLLHETTRKPDDT